MDQFAQDPFSAMTGDDAAHNRNEARDSLFLMADFRVPGSSDVSPVRVRNLSAGGLMAEIANIAGGLVCEEVGTAAINKDRLLNECKLLLDVKSEVR